eukprot:4945428-Prymnesium_polylepis.1
MRHWLMCVWVCEVCMCVCVTGRRDVARVCAVLCGAGAAVACTHLSPVALWVGHPAPHNHPLPAYAQSGGHRISPKASRRDASPVLPRAPSRPRPATAAKPARTTAVLPLHIPLLY